ncbi:hypothetical protein MAR_007447 [Mya arenaria]|uniref:Uncharacterized protein n=1 Tax=Mya arenaria TaxID=6604 RepID=A0ABY7DD52_MYAAR|nr:hypothetical protein MAR_007447 [Mya arenaria]
MGGTRSKQCNNNARVVWKYAYQHNIWLTAEHVPGKDNYLADIEIFPPEIDLFASRLNHQEDNYISWRADPGSACVDAFNWDWSKYRLYAFPPFSLIDRESPTDKLSFKLLTLKMVMLMALLSCQKAQSLQLLDAKNMSHVPFVINQLIKQARPGFHVKPITFRRYTYDNKAASKEGKLVVCLFVSKNHIKQFQLQLSQDGYISTYECRSAATSAAFGTGTSIQTIMNAAGWSPECSSNKFYNKQMPHQKCSLPYI